MDVDAYVESSMVDSLLDPQREHDCPDLPRDFGKDFDASFSSDDSYIEELHLFLLWPALDRQCEIFWIRPLARCYLVEARYGGFLQGKVIFILSLGNFASEQCYMCCSTTL